VREVGEGEGGVGERKGGGDGEVEAPRADSSDESDEEDVWGGGVGGGGDRVMSARQYRTVLFKALQYIVHCTL